MAAQIKLTRLPQTIHSIDGFIDWKEDFPNLYPEVRKLNEKEPEIINLEEDTPQPPTFTIEQVQMLQEMAKDIRITYELDMEIEAATPKPNEDCFQDIADLGETPLEELMDIDLYNVIT